MLDFVYLAIPLGLFGLTGLYAVACDRLQERAMADPIIGLVIAATLGLYLVCTLLHPEKF